MLDESLISCDANLSDFTPPWAPTATHRLQKNSSFCYANIRVETARARGGKVITQSVHKLWPNTHAQALRQETWKRDAVFLDKTKKNFVYNRSRRNIAILTFMKKPFGAITNFRVPLDKVPFLFVTFWRVNIVVAGQITMFSTAPFRGSRANRSDRGVKWDTYWAITNPRRHDVVSAGNFRSVDFARKAFGKRNLLKCAQCNCTCFHHLLDWNWHRYIRIMITCFQEMPLAKKKKC